MTAERPFGRTNEPVAAVWHEHPDGVITAGSWRGLIVGPADLDRRGGVRVRERVAAAGHRFDLLLVRDVLAGDLKIGWPLHRLQRLRDERLFRYYVIDTHDPLEAEWIAANAPVHGVGIAYDASDMAAKYRVFDAAANSGVALIGHGSTAEAAALQLATPAITATRLSPGVAVTAEISAATAEAIWTTYAATHAEPPKLRGGHPPDEG